MKKIAKICTDDAVIKALEKTSDFRPVFFDGSGDDLTEHEDDTGANGRN